MPQVDCPGCGGVLPLADDQLDRPVECGRCGRVFVPADEPDDGPPDYSDSDYLPPRRRTSLGGQFAVAGLVLGIIGLTLSIVLFCCPFVAMPFGLLGIVFGMLGRRSENGGLAVGGITTGSVAVLISTTITLVWFVLQAAK